MRKNTLIKLISIVLTTAIAFSFIAAGMPEKPEEKIDTREGNVYVMTDATGQSKKLILTNSIIDVLPKASGKGLPVYDSDGKKLDCGKLDDQLPVDIKISYTLDGKSISPKKLAGKSGHLVIRYDYKNLCQTEAVIAGKNEKINVPFAVMTGMIVDNANFKNIQVSSGKIISDGTRSIVAGIALPGLQENLNIDKDLVDFPEFVEISADVTDFSLSMSLSIVTNKILGDDKKIDLDTGDMDAALRQLRDAMNMLIDGSGKLFNGLTELYDKSGVLSEGVGRLTDGLRQLDSHTGELNDGALQVFNTLLATANQQIADKGIEIPTLTVDNYQDVLTHLIDSLDPEALLEVIKNRIIQEMEPVRPEFRQTAYVILDAKLCEQARQAEYVKIAEQVQAEDHSAEREKMTQLVKADVILEVTDNIKREVQAQVLEEKGIGDYSELLPIAPSDPGFDAIAELKKAKLKIEVDKEILVRMANADTVARIDSETAARMESEEIQNRIEDKVQSAIKVTIGLRIAEQNERIEHDVRTTVDEQIKSPENQALIEQYTDDLMKEAVAKALQNEIIHNKVMESAQESVKALGQLLAGLNGYAQFYYGLLTYTAGVSTAREGAETLYSNMPALQEGVKQLKEGGEMLNNGIIRFDKEGISRITNALDGQLGELRERIKASIDAAENYKGISTLPDNAPAVSFVYRSDAIEK